MNATELKPLIEKTITQLKLKISESSEDIVKVFLEEYLRVFTLINNLGDMIEKEEFRKMKTFTRMYMETSSNYSQEFLNTMSVVESNIEKYFS